MNLQAMMDAVGASLRATRAEYQVTLGRALREIEACVGDATVCALVNGRAVALSTRLLSYRGYYSDLAVAPLGDGEATVTVLALRNALRAVLDTELIGYKGGEFRMDAKTPLRVSAYGECSGRAVMQIVPHGGGVALLCKDTNEDGDS